MTLNYIRRTTFELDMITENLTHYDTVVFSNGSGIIVNKLLLVLVNVITVRRCIVPMGATSAWPHILLNVIVAH